MISDANYREGRIDVLRSLSAYAAARAETDRNATAALWLLEFLYGESTDPVYGAGAAARAIADALADELRRIFPEHNGNVIPFGPRPVPKD